MGGTPDWYKDSYSPNGHCSLWEKAKEYVYAVIHGRTDEERTELHRHLAACYGLKPSETRHVTDNLPIPMDPYAESFETTLANCASIITNEFQKLSDFKYSLAILDPIQICGTTVSG